MGSGKMAPAQHLMGHLLLLAVCTMAPHSLHFTCVWKRSTAIGSENVPENFQMTIKEEIFKSYFYMFFRQIPVMFGLFTPTYLNDNMFFPMTLLAMI
jgi:hypothetical protein